MTGAIKVLIADDNRDFCILKISFQPDFELVDVCSNGLEGSEALNKGRCPGFGSIIPHMDGIGFWKRWSMSPRPKVIILTAFGQENITQKAVQLGADYYILKPFNLRFLETG